MSSSDIILENDKVIEARINYLTDKYLAELEGNFNENKTTLKKDYYNILRNKDRKNGRNGRNSKLRFRRFAV